MSSVIETNELENIRALISSVHNKPVRAEDDAFRLSAQLAFLNAFYYRLPDEYDSRELPDPPKLDYNNIRTLALKAFPFLGPYNDVASLTDEIGETRILVGDSLDDLVDILLALMDFVWRFEHTSESDAIWHFKETYRTHWSAHLIGLQRFLSAFTTLAIHHKDNFNVENRNGA